MILSQLRLNRFFGDEDQVFDVRARETSCDQGFAPEPTGDASSPRTAVELAKRIEELPLSPPGLLSSRRRGRILYTAGVLD